ncbi:GAP family protein [Nocardioides sambongensis]|uniref:GAP family protein n=1 Tax=Nocardioides sambongensis TaxID=2589074 RepID=UPI00112B5122|nr:GAP family protein [Nocardioides sambongensis]
MTIAALLGLIGLALVDSTSVGTLVLPLLMLTHPRMRASRVVVYLATISAFYLALGLALLAGADLLGELGEQVEESRTVDVVQLVVGVGLLVGSFWPDTPWAKRAAERRAADATPGRARRWVDTVAAADSRWSTVVGVALAAGLIEAASMLPYLGAVALISTSGLPPAGQVATLAGYVAVMSLPALILLVARMALHRQVSPTLERLSDWLARRTTGAIWWAIGIIGFLVATDAARRLFG